jgi:uncharacterized protein (TIGR04141 family)
MVDGNAFCINNGKWYRINNEFVEQINQDYSCTPISTIDFDDFTDLHGSENAYSKDFRENRVM